MRDAANVVRRVCRHVEPVRVNLLLIQWNSGIEIYRDLEMQQRNN